MMHGATRQGEYKALWTDINDVTTMLDYPMPRTTLVGGPLNFFVLLVLQNAVA